MGTQKKKLYEDDILLPSTNKDVNRIFSSNHGFENKLAKPRLDVILPLWRIATQEYQTGTGMSYKRCFIAKNQVNIILMYLM